MIQEDQIDIEKLRKSIEMITAGNVDEAIQLAEEVLGRTSSTLNNLSKEFIDKANNFNKREWSERLIVYLKNRISIIEEKIKDRRDFLSEDIVYTCNREEQIKRFRNSFDALGATERKNHKVFTYIVKGSKNDSVGKFIDKTLKVSTVIEIKDDDIHTYKLSRSNKGIIKTVEETITDLLFKIAKEKLGKTMSDLNYGNFATQYPESEFVIINFKLECLEDGINELVKKTILWIQTFFCKKMDLDASLKVLFFFSLEHQEEQQIVEPVLEGLVNSTITASIDSHTIFNPAILNVKEGVGIPLEPLGIVEMSHVKRWYDENFKEEFKEEFKEDFEKIVEKPLEEIEERRMNKVLNKLRRFVDMVNKKKMAIR